jgi:hypothetical protein
MERNKRKSMIKVRGGFSEKIGLSTCTIKMQTNEFDDRTRTLIGNHLYDVLSVVFSYASTIGISRYLNPSRQSPLQAMSSDFCKDVLSEVLNVSVHLPSNKFYNWEANYDRFAEIISSAPYNEVLDFLWYVCHWIATHTTSTSFVHEIYNGFNQLFEKEYVGYRFVAGEITPITNSLEIQEIEQACQIPFEGAHVQLQKALGFLSDREHPDYKNSIKESISAVESVCKVIANKPKAELGDALKALIAEGYPIQGALKTGILALYGYTCEAGGIRHAERETESTVTFEEAKFMMVTCSAIVNYLVAEYGKHGAGNA